MSSFASYDGTGIGYHVRGDGLPLVCLPGGPGRAAEYLGDLGGLSKSRRLVLLDPRGALARRAAEPWYPAARAALEKIMAGDMSIEAFRDSRPFFYGRWDETAQAHATVGVSERHQAAREGYFAAAVGSFLS